MILYYIRLYWQDYIILALLYCPYCLYCRIVCVVCVCCRMFVVLLVLSYCFCCRSVVFTGIQGAREGLEGRPLEGVRMQEPGPQCRKYL